MGGGTIVTPPHPDLDRRPRGVLEWLDAALEFK
jgi:hypothetical protein